ncbi:MAG: radical SAM protein [Elusimicrobia bacterium]|nr:radical SAM protein [Elusimicrobiota bacterium]
MKLYVQSFGCQMNTADSEELGRVLAAYGFEPASNLEKAGAVLVNTCTVRQHAEDKAVSYIGALRKWKQEKPNRLLIVAGCAAERIKETLRERFPYVDLVVGAKSIEQFPEIIKEILLKRNFGKKKFNEPLTLPRSAELRGRRYGQRPWPPSPARGEGCKRGGVSTFVTIMRGCNFACSYCIVPSVRGREVYRPADAILEEIEGRVQRGIKEIVLLGQTVNSYKNRKGWEAKRGSLDSRPAPQPHSGGRGRLESQKDATSFGDGVWASTC